MSKNILNFSSNKEERGFEKIPFFIVLLVYCGDLYNVIKTQRYDDS